MALKKKGKCDACGLEKPLSKETPPFVTLCVDCWNRVAYDQEPLVIKKQEKDNGS
jgi:hypothetical protein